MLKRRIPLRWLPLSDGSICIWWHDKEIVVNQEDFRLFSSYYHTCRPTRVKNPDGTVYIQKIPILFPPRRGRKKTRKPPLHSVIMGVHHWQKVIHLDGDQYNCRKTNLRVWTNNSKLDWTKELKK